MGLCGIGRPFGDEEPLRRYLSTGQTTKLHRRLAADAKALLALYGRLHGAVRLRWGFLDEMFADHVVLARDRDLAISAGRFEEAARLRLSIHEAFAPSQAAPTLVLLDRLADAACLGLRRCTPAGDRRGYQGKRGRVTRGLLLR